MKNMTVAVHIRVIACRERTFQRLERDRGEGVLSMAIAVLIVAAVGAAMWVVLKDVGEQTGDRIQNQVNEIGG